MWHKTFFFNLHTWEHHWREATKGAGCSGSVIFRGWLEGSLHRQCLAIKIYCCNFPTNNDSLLICFFLELSFLNSELQVHFLQKLDFHSLFMVTFFIFSIMDLKMWISKDFTFIVIYYAVLATSCVKQWEVAAISFWSGRWVLNLCVRFGNPPALPVHSQLLFPIRSKSTFPKSYQSGLFSINCINLDAKDLAINSRILVPLYGICKLVVVCVSANYFTSGWVLLLQVSCRIVLLQWKVIHLVVINERHWMLRHWNSGLRHV